MGRHPERQGSVTIKLYTELDNLEGLERRLRTVGVRAELDGYANDKQCQSRDRWTPSASSLADGVRHDVYERQRPIGRPMELTIDGAQMAADETLVIDHRKARRITDDNGDGSIRFMTAGGHLKVDVAKGEVAPCELVDGPASEPGDPADWPRPGFCVDESVEPAPPAKDEVIKEAKGQPELEPCDLPSPGGR